MTILWLGAAVVVVLFALTLKPPARFGVLATLCMVAVFFFPTVAGRSTFEWGATYVAVLLLAAVAIISQGLKVIPVAFIPLFAFLAVGMVFAWSGSNVVTYTVVNIVFFVVALIAGGYLGGLYRENPSAERVLVVLILLFVGFEAVIAIGQTLGLGWFPLSGRSGDLEGGRSSGTFPHPATIGKLTTLLMVLVLPSTQSRSRGTAGLAIAAVVAAIAATAASVSRANTLALILMVIVWSLLQPSTRSFLNRFGMPLVVGVVSLFFAGEILLRVEETDDFARAHFLEVAWRQLQLTPWVGVGPGEYVLVVGRFDHLTAQGWPVHNTFMLTAVELGLIGAVLLWLPVAWIFLRAFRHLRGVSRESDFARSIVSYVPPLLLIGTTGWGLLTPDNAVRLFFVLGFAAAQFSRAPQPPPFEPAPHERARRVGGRRSPASHRGTVR